MTHDSSPDTRARIGAAPISWGVCEADNWGFQLDAESVLADMRATGVSIVECGPDGFLPDDIADARSLLSRFGLHAQAAFVPVDVDRPLPTIEPAFRTQCQRLTKLGCTVAVIAAMAAPTDTQDDMGAHTVATYDRRQTAADDSWATILDTLDTLDAIAAEHGLAAALHPHVGTLVERQHDLDVVVSGSSIGLCLDTGHMLLGGIDTAAVVRNSAARIRHVHLKDVDAVIASRYASGDCDYSEAVARGLYVPIGTGSANVAEIVSTLEASGYSGAYIVEQDVRLDGQPSAQSDITRRVVTSIDAVERAIRTATAVDSPPPQPITQADIVAIGRIGVDLYPQQDGPLYDVRSFSKSLGGSAANVAVAAARLGLHAALVTKVGADQLGDYCVRALSEFGVNTTLVGRSQHLPTPIVFAELDPPEDPGLIFYRYPTAPDLTITAEDIDTELVRTARLIWLTGTGLSASPSREATMAALTMASGSIRVLDLDWRPMLWHDTRDASEIMMRAALNASVVVGNQAEVEVVTGQRDPNAAADFLLDSGIETVIVKCGAEGVLLARQGERVQVPGTPVDVVCGLGSGDAFGGALCYGLLHDWPLEQIGHYANTAGAIVASRLACADAMPTDQEIRELLEESSR